MAVWPDPFGREDISLHCTRGQQEPPARVELPAYDPACYLCPGNRRAQGQTNPNYETTFVFVNDYSAVKEEQEEYNPNNVGPSKNRKSSTGQRGF